MKKRMHSTLFDCKDCHKHYVVCWIDGYYVLVMYK